MNNKAISLMVLLVTSTCHLASQSFTGTLIGTVKDPSGAVILAWR